MSSQVSLFAYTIFKVSALIRVQGQKLDLQEMTVLPFQPLTPDLMSSSAFIAVYVASIRFPRDLVVPGSVVLER